MSSEVELDTGFSEAIESFGHVEEAPISDLLKWVALQLQAPLYYFSECIFREMFTATPFKPNPLDDKIHRVSMTALGIMTSPFTLTLGILGAGVYRLSDIVNQRPYTYFHGKAQEVEPNGNAKILSLNACMMPGGLPYVLGGMRPATERMDDLANLIKEQDPDVLLMQEMSYAPSRDLYEKLKDKYAHFYLRIGPNSPMMESGLLVASKYPIENAGFLPFSGQLAIYRGAFWIETKDSVIFTTHMDSGAQNNDLRVQQLAAIRNKMEEFKGKKPCFLLGDLNIDRYVEGHYEDCKVDEFFHNPQENLIPTFSNKLEADVRGQKPLPETREHDDYALRFKDEVFQYDMEIDWIETYNEDKPFEAITDHKGLLLTATRK